MAMNELERDAIRLVDRLVDLGPSVIAYSGGVDSAVVAAAAWRADKLRASLALSASEYLTESIAVTADSPSVAREQLETAKDVACQIGIAHQILYTDEMSREEYRVNDRRRCFFCKETLYTTLRRFADEHRIAVIVSGTNADDLGDYRPGIEAGRQAGVISPLAELGMTKPRVRQLAFFWSLSVADRPAQPCLSSRIAYGIGVTPDRLRKVELAESFLRSLGFTPLRVRIVGGGQAKIEVAIDDIDRLQRKDVYDQVERYLLSIGFPSVSVDPFGFRSGSLNEVVALVAPTPEL